MTRKQLEDLGLTKEQADSVMKINGDDIENAMMLSRLVDTFFSRTSWTMLLYAGNHSISVA